MLGVGSAADVPGHGSLGLSHRILTSRARLPASEDSANSSNGLCKDFQLYEALQA